MHARGYGTLCIVHVHCMYTQACEMNDFIRAGPTLLSMAA